MNWTRGRYTEATIGPFSLAVIRQRDRNRSGWSPPESRPGPKRDDAIVVLIDCDGFHVDDSGDREFPSVKAAKAWAEQWAREKVTAMLADLGARSPANEDADLLQAWEVYAAKVRENDRLEADLGIDEMDPLWTAQGEAAAAMLDIPAHTVAGVAAKLRWFFDEMFAGHLRGEVVHAAIFHGEPLSGEMAEYHPCRAFWNLIQEVDRMAGAPDSPYGAANPVHDQIAPRELVWWGILHCDDNTYWPDERTIIIDRTGTSPGIVVPVVPGSDEIRPDTSSPLWPAAEAALRARRRASEASS